MAMIEYGQAIAEDPKHVPEELFAKLKANFTEEEIVVITAMGVMMIANNYFNEPDDAQGSPGGQKTGNPINEIS